MKRLLVVVFLGALTSITTSTPVFSQSSPPVFDDNFEAETAFTAQPVWRWSLPYARTRLDGAPYGVGDLFERSSEVAFSGQYSLRLNFDGRNGFCNTCGTDSHVVANGINSDVSFRTTTTDPLVMLPSASRPVYNRTDGWAQWISTGNESGTVSFSSRAPARNEMAGGGRFNAGDELRVARECGVDGTVGGNVSRRSDCNIAINYLQGISEADFPFGGTLARRFYFYIPESTVLPGSGFKFGYATFKKASGANQNVIPVLDVSRGNEIVLHTQAIAGVYTFTKMKIARDRWYYIEEVYKRESAAGVTDGVYTAYLSEATSVADAPIATYSGVEFGRIVAMSISGNWQHTNQCTGYIYFDDVMIAKGKIGAVNAGITLPPSAPALTVE